MKKLLIFLSFFTLTGNLCAQASSSNFTITSSSGSNSLTCLVSSLNYSAATQVIGPVYFKWTSTTATLSGANVTINQPGNYVVTVEDSTHTVFGTQYLSIVTNTTPPNGTVSPTLQNISCNTTVGVPIVSSGSGNLTHMFLSPNGTSVIVAGSAASYTPLGPGTYTVVLTDNDNGCQSSSNFTLVSSQGFPTFSVTSPQNYTLGCGSHSVITINIVNAGTAPVPGGPISYTFMPLSESAPAPPGVLSSNSNYTVTTPGLYYVIVRDNTNLCATQIPVSIISNTSAPNISVTIPTQILNCDIPQAIIQGSSTNTNVSYNWTFTGAPGSAAGNTVLVTSNAAAPTVTFVNSYTLSVTDNVNSCTGTSVIPVYQNLFPPVAIISVPSATLTCATPTTMLTNLSASGIPTAMGFPTNQFVVGFAWYGPSTPSASMTSVYVASTAGTYTLIVKDLNNGCMSTTTAKVYDDCNLVGLQKNSISGVNLRLFPNPSNGVFTLVSEVLQKSISFEIYNSIGALIKKQTLNSERTPVDITDQASGIYIIHIRQNDQIVQTLKLVKE